MKSFVMFCAMLGLLIVFSSSVSAEDIVVQDKRSSVEINKVEQTVPQWAERRIIMPHYFSNNTPRSLNPVEKMPHPSNEYDGTFHFLPHLYIGPNQGRGFGSHFGLRLGTPFFKSHGFQFGINLY